MRQDHVVVRTKRGFQPRACTPSGAASGTFCGHWLDPLFLGEASGWRLRLPQSTERGHCGCLRARPRGTPTMTISFAGEPMPQVRVRRVKRISWIGAVCFRGRRLVHSLVRAHGNCTPADIAWSATCSDAASKVPRALQRAIPVRLARKYRPSSSP